MADTSLSEKKIGLLIWQVSNYWQSKLRKILKEHELTLNEYLIFESIHILKDYKNELSQIDVSKFSGISMRLSPAVSTFPSTDESSGLFALMRI